MSVRSALGLALLLTGVVCLVLYGAGVHAREAFQRERNLALDRVLERTMPAPVQRERLPRRATIGRLEIPRVGLSAIVVEGDDGATLRRSIGHLPDTALPWQAGNSVMAGHRDTFFRPLEDVRPGDEIRLVSPHGTFVYRVRETAITTPDDLTVIAPSPHQELTLLTCYPFYYVGSAPKRYVVRAARLR